MTGNRVICSAGRIGSYLGAPDAKRTLLTLEAERLAGPLSLPWVCAP